MMNKGIFTDNKLCSNQDEIKKLISKTIGTENVVAVHKKKNFN